MALLAALAVAAAVFAALWAIVGRRATAPSARLLQCDRSAPIDREQLLAVPFAERVGAPLARRLRSVFGRFLPESVVSALERRLLVAGEPISLHGFLTFQGTCLGVAVLLLVAAISSGGGRQLLALLVLALIVALVPIYWLRIKISARKRALVKAFPDAVDLIVTSVEAGLGIEAALNEVGNETRGPLGEELRMAVRETTLGRSRRDSLQRLVERTNVPEIKAFVQSLIQAEQTGIPIGQVLRTQAGQVRLKRRQRAEADAQRAPIKMILVLVVFVLPSMLLTVMGPAIM